MLRWRKHSMLLIVLLALSLVAAACSGNGDGGAPAGGANGAGEPAGEAGDDGNGGGGESADAGGGDISAGTPDPNVPCTDNPIMISTIEQLQAIADNVNASSTHDFIDGHYALSNDIDASATQGWNDGEGFRPIGTLSAPFTGCFDGRGFTIKGLHIDRTGHEGAALFGGAVRSYFSNVTLEDVYVRGSNNSAGLVGETNATDITNVHVSGTIAGAMQVGGVVADLQGGILSKSSSSAHVSSAWTNGEDMIFRVRSTGVLAGRSTGDIIASFSTGSATGGDFVGGLVGDNQGDIFESYSTAEVRGVVGVGGLAGVSRGDIENTYSLATVIVEEGAYGGGLVGSNEFGTVSYSFSAGEVIGEGDAEGLGGLVGWDRTFHQFEPGLKAYWDTDASGMAASDSGEGHNTDAMRQQATFEDWDFDGIWTIDEGQDYPDLRAVPR